MLDHELNANTAGEGATLVISRVPFTTPPIFRAFVPIGNGKHTESAQPQPPAPRGTRPKTRKGRDVGLWAQKRPQNWYRATTCRQ